ncbi:kinase-like protein [Aspergillus indologenus CBS 114.80]|uniref:Kinase-like protein n=1 Tax=Aspergillus indologenus CBS 114.80 TaxID=1450541 RepID=A0A2V5IER5_9EURO|nr:kinase-like protein [Aspergillus indologenus CBS 114.80]
MILHSLYGRKVVRVEENRVIKSGPNLRAHEAQTLRFVADNTTIPVPTVHETRWEGSQVVAIVMDYMPGKRLDEAWKTLDPGQKSSIARQLHSYLVQLRRLKGTYIGAVGHGKACIGQRASVVGGPFDSEQQFNTFILEDLVKLPDVLQHYAKHALTDNHEIVFTHGDFAPRNILVEGDRVTAVLDWEDAGWYPEYWEYIKALQHLKPMPDWPEYLPVILPPRYEKEYLGMAFLARLLRH